MSDQSAQLRELRLLIREEMERHATTMEAIERRIRLMLGETAPRPRLSRLVSPDGKVSEIKYR